MPRQCEPLPPCSNSPSSIYLNSTTTTSANFYWTENSNATSWEVEFVPQGTPPTGSGTIITSRPYTKTGLTSNTWYDLYIRSKCGNVNSTWTGPFPFNTQADYCGGDHFYDDGGPNGNYPAYDSQYVTIYPIGTGNRVKAIFNSLKSFKFTADASHKIQIAFTGKRDAYCLFFTNILSVVSIPVFLMLYAKFM